MPKLADYYVQVIPSMKGVKNSLESQLGGAATSAGSSAGGKFSSAFSSGLTTVATGAAKVTAAAITAASTGVAALTKAAVSSYSEYEQLVGGVQTLFTPTESMSEFVTKMGEIGVSAETAAQKYNAGAEKVMSDASNAWKTAGLSVNEYMEQATSYSAKLIKETGGDTERVAELVNIAITDMSDNANKMGTSIESIQNAYEGFAKGNATMLDNLKVGYGGTQTELLKLAQDMGVVEESVTSFNDMTFEDAILAIHEVQEQLGITGTTAEEATTTISGSLGMLSASWSNLVTGLADENANLDELIENVMKSLVGYVDDAGNEVNGFLDNIIPVIETTLTSIGDLITKLMPNILDLLPTLINDVLPDIITAGTELMQGLVDAMNDSSNMESVKNVISQLVNSLVKMLPDIIALGGEIVGTLGSAIMDNLDTILGAAGQLLETILTGLSENSEKLSTGAVTLISMLAGFIGENIDLILNSALLIVEGLANGLIENLDTLMNAGLDLLMAIVDAIPDFLVELANALPDIITAIIDFLTGDGLTDILEGATTMFMGLVEALPDILNALVDGVGQLIDSVLSFMSGDGSSEILESAFYMFLNIAAALPEILGTLLGALGELLVHVVTSLHSYASNMKNAAKELFGKIKDAVVEIGSEVISKIKEKVKEWVDAIKNKVSEFKDAGKNLIIGLWNGIADKAQWVYDKITGMGSTIVNKVKGIFGISSPSKVFAEIGGYLAEGLEIGWSDEIENVQREINSDLEFSSSIKTANNYDNKASDQELGTFTIHDYISLDGTNMQDKIAKYTIKKMGNETRAINVSQGGYYGSL